MPTEMIEADDGHMLSVFHAGDGPGLVVLQEIFGVNSHIRSVVERFAEAGFSAAAPALFDRIEPGLETGYTPDDITRARGLRARIQNEDALRDIAATRAFLKTRDRPVGVVGYCWGGSLAWLSASTLSGLSAAVGYYGGEIAKNRGLTPACPVMLHFGEQDHGIPMDDVQAVHAAHPDMQLYTYAAGHGFSFDARASFDAVSHETALARTHAFLRTHLVS